MFLRISKSSISVMVVVGGITMLAGGGGMLDGREGVC
jgi:hypothetical protein